MIAQSWKSWCWKLRLVSVLTSAGVIASTQNPTLAQIRPIPDATLGAESSVITPNVAINGLPSDQIDGGAIRGTNLFHSFQEFNINEGRGAYFTNPAGIENILSRVTGNDSSNILGTLGVLGNANLFLINPNGIIFGPNAALNVGGSFVATTANAIGLANGDIFSANPVAPLPTDLLSVNPNAFLFNQITAQPIINRSIAKLTGLQVPQNQTLLLVGGDVKLEGGQMLVLGGRVELGGLAASGSVGLSMNNSLMSLSFPEGVVRADVYLTNSGTNRARVNVAASHGGSIAINARNINIVGSTLRGGIEKKLGFLGAQGGDISLNATGEINLVNGVIFNRLEPEATGNAGSINITTGSLSMKAGALVGTATFGSGNAGSVTITAQNTVSLEGGSIPSDDDGVFAQVIGDAKGDGGDINITARSLSLKNGFRLGANTFAQGNAGNITITVRDIVSLDGRPTAVVSRVIEDAVGNGGDIKITAGSLSMKNGARLETRTNGQGNAGSINIITTGSLSMKDGARLAASTNGQGNVGSINITAGSFLLMRNQSSISAQASNNAEGGNITINAANGFIVAAPGEDSDIIANASAGQGGNIDITTQGIFGMEEREAITMNGTNDIDASSQFGVNGVVEINTPDVDPSQGLVELPDEPVNVEVAEGCQTGEKQASTEFFNTGRGGLAPNPYEPISSSYIWEDVPTATQRAENSTGAASPSTSPATPPNKIVEAQEWLMSEKGEVILVAEVPITGLQAGCSPR